VLELLGQLVYLLTLLTDDHAHACRPDVDDDFFAGPLDLDLRDPRAAVLLVAVLDEPADLLVLDQELGEILLVGKPPALPIHQDAGAKTGGSDFLSHGSFQKNNCPRPVGAGAGQEFAVTDPVLSFAVARFIGFGSCRTA